MCLQNTLGEDPGSGHFYLGKTGHFYFALTSVPSNRYRAMADSSSRAATANPFASARRSALSEGRRVRHHHRTANDYPQRQKTQPCIGCNQGLRSAATKSISQSTAPTFFCSSIIPFRNNASHKPRAPTIRQTIIGSYLDNTATKSRCTSLWKQGLPASRSPPRMYPTRYSTLG
jgi:hypothetical protein